MFSISIFYDRGRFNSINYQLFYLNFNNYNQGAFCIYIIFLKNSLYKQLIDDLHKKQLFEKNLLLKMYLLYLNQTYVKVWLVIKITSLCDKFVLIRTLSNQYGTTLCKHASVKLACCV